MYARKLHIAWNHKNSFYQEILRYFRFMFIHWSNFCCSCVADCLKTTFHIFPIENISYFLQLKFLLPFWSSPPLPSPSCLLSLNRARHSLNNAAVYIESSNQETLCFYLQVAQKNAQISSRLNRFKVRKKWTGNDQNIVGKRSWLVRTEGGCTLQSPLWRKHRIEMFCNLKVIW